MFASTRPLMSALGTTSTHWPRSTRPNGQTAKVVVTSGLVTQFGTTLATLVAPT